MTLKPKDFDLLNAFEKLTIHDRNVILALINILKERDVENIYENPIKTMEAIKRFQLNTKTI